MCAAARDKKPGFDSEYTGEILKIKLRGEIDHHSAVALRGAVDDMIRQKRPHKLVIDMSAVELMDSSGLGLIMGRYALMNEMGGATVVLDPSPRVEKIMSLAGLERIVRVEYSARKEPSADHTSHEQRRRAVALNSVDDFGGAKAHRTRKEGEEK